MILYYCLCIGEILSFSASVAFAVMLLNEIRTNGLFTEEDDEN